MTSLLQFGSFDLTIRLGLHSFAAQVWAKGKGVCGAGEGNLSSYSWTIMAKTPAVLWSFFCLERWDSQ